VAGSNGKGNQRRKAKRAKARGTHPAVPPQPLPGEGPAPFLASHPDLRLAERAITAAFPIDAEMRTRLVGEADRIMCTSSKPHFRLRAMQIIVAADRVNVAREANTLQERSAETEAALGAMRQALQTPEGREALAAATRRLFSPPATANGHADAGGPASGG
jgi:hypothetical protein